MGAQLELGDISVDLVLKDIKNIHLSVYPPTGKVRISAPSRMTADAIRAFAISKLDWIRRMQDQLREQERESPREYVDRESHFVWGRRCLLTVVQTAAAPSVEISPGRMQLAVRPGTDEQGRHAIVEAWYRDQIRAAVPPLLGNWEPLTGVKVEKFFIQRMKTKWGSCNQRNRTIRLNTELAKKPLECLEYLVVHELAHLIEPTHNARFVATMDRFMPHWRDYRSILNALPVRRESWSY